jgi:hypothetical protein
MPPDDHPSTTNDMRNFVSTLVLATLTELAQAAKRDMVVGNFA